MLSFMLYLYLRWGQIILITHKNICWITGDNLTRYWHLISFSLRFSEVRVRQELLFGFLEGEKPSIWIVRALLFITALLLLGVFLLL